MIELSLWHKAFIFDTDVAASWAQQCRDRRSTGKSCPTDVGAKGKFLLSFLSQR
jgi:hypothetical protein